MNPETSQVKMVKDLVKAEIVKNRIKTFFEELVEAGYPELDNGEETIDFESLAELLCSAVDLCPKYTIKLERYY